MTRRNIERAMTELRKASDILDIALDYIANSAKITILVPGHIRETILFSGLVDLQYAPGFSDSPPWIIGEVRFEKLSNEDELMGGEGLWCHGKRSYEKAFPCYRVSLQSGDFRLKILCIKFEVLNR